MLTIIEDKPKLVLGAEKWQAAPFRFLDNLQVFEDSIDPGYKLPNGYIRLKWVESDGTAYLNTGIYATENTGARVKYEYTASGSAAILGIYHASPRDDALFISTNSGALDTTNVFAAHGGATIQNGPVALNTEYTTSINFKGDGKIHVGNTVASIGSTAPYNQYPILLGARYNAGNGNITGSHSKIKIAEFTEGKVFSHRYIPCISPNRVVGYYDVVTQTFSGSSTSTPFIAGPVVLPAGYTQLEYIESTGTQYIDLGKISSDDIIDMKFEWTRVSNNYILGSLEDGSNWQGGKMLGITYYGTSQRAFYNRGATTASAGSTPTIFSITADTEYTIHWQPSSNKITVNGTQYTGTTSNKNQTTDVFETANNLYLFCANRGGVAGSFDYLKMRDFSIAGKRNPIPCKHDSDNVIGMYDLVTNTFLTNQGTGNFVPGPIVA